jgi:nucleoside-diphosphate-sugar epimerase
VRVVIAGGGGFIGGHLAASYLADGHEVRCVDRAPLHRWHQRHHDAEQVVADLNDPRTAADAVAGCDVVINLACDMGGMGFIEHHKARCMTSVLTNTHLIVAATEAGAGRYFFASTACVYPAGLQDSTAPVALKESDAYPADPEDGYGWEKLFGERMCRHYAEDFGLDVRIARFHNVFGPLGTWRGGREKAPAAICRKIAIAELTGEHRIEVWGDGEQRRSFLYVDDAVDGVRRLMASDVDVPVNIGSEHTVSVNQLVALVSDIAGIQVERHHDLTQPQGVRGRTSDNTFVREHLGWEPTVALRDGLERTYTWIRSQVENDLAAARS